MRLEDFADETCEWCGKGFSSARGRLDQRFCCPDCRNAAKSFRRKHPVVTKTCPNCRTSFQTTRPNQQKYCCERCRYVYGHAFAIAVKAETLRRARAGKTCARCGSLFDAKIRSDQIYCGSACRIEAMQDMARERRAMLRRVAGEGDL